MKIKNILLTIYIYLFYLSNAYSQDCPLYGNAKNDREKQLNIRKNQSAQIPNINADSLSLNLLLTKTSKPDSSNFIEGIYVVVDGYLVSFEEEGAESCNCGLANASEKTGDVHIYVGLIPNAEKKNCIIVEITPAFKKLHSNYQSYLNIGTKIRVYGFLIYDYMHEQNAVDTCTSCKNVWRKSCWEIHPVTQIIYPKN